MSSPAWFIYQVWQLSMSLINSHTQTHTHRHFLASHIWPKLTYMIFKKIYLMHLYLFWDARCLRFDFLPIWWREGNRCLQQINKQYYGQIKMQINLYFMRKQFRQSIARWTSSAGAGFGSSLAIVHNEGVYWNWRCPSGSHCSLRCL